MDQSINNAFVAVPSAVVTVAPAASRLGASLRVKRCFDLGLAGAIVCVLAPLFVFVALILLLAQGRPIFVAHQRVGKGGKRFPCLKFRTMVVDGDRLLSQYLERHSHAREEWELTRKLQRDPRVTPLGAALRASSVDELPQLINVLRGDMSLVGPRPVIKEELDLYGSHASKYLSVRPGLTGAWQVSGRSMMTFAERVKIDVDYVEGRHLMKDIWIMLRTVPAVLLSRGAV